MKNQTCKIFLIESSSMVDKSNHETEEEDDPERKGSMRYGVTQLSGEWAQKAFRELKETPEAVEKGLAELKKLISKETNLNAKTDDAFLLRFLRAKKFDVPKSFFTLQRYYQMKYECPELFKVPRPSDKLHILNMQCQSLLQHRDNNGSRVYIFRVEKCDVSQVSVEDVFCTNVMALEMAVREPETQVAGVTAIVDMNGFGLQQHAKFLSPYYAKRTVDVVQETFPLRFKGFHVVNQPFYFDAVYSVLKPFLKEKIRKRIYLHGKDFKSLHNHVNKDILPLEYGGSDPFDNSHFKRSLLNLEDEFSEMEEYGFISLPTKIDEGRDIDKVSQDE